MPHTQYFIAHNSNLDPYAQQGKFSSIPVTPGDTSPDREVIVAYLGDLDPTADTSVDCLPDALRAKVISQVQAVKLASHGVLPTDTTFDVVDKLSLYSRDMRFQII